MGACQAKNTALGVFTGGAGLALAGSSCGKPTRELLLNSTNDIISNTIVQRMLACTTSNTSLQLIELKCQPSGVYESNAACSQCMQNVFQGIIDQHQYELSEWKRGEVKVRLPIDQEYNQMVQRLESCGISFCKACSLVNATQESVIKSFDQCQSTLITSDSFKADLGANLATELNNNQHILSGVSEALGNKDLGTITNTLVNQLTTNMNEDFQDRLVSQLSQSQTIRLDSTGSFNGDGLLQKSAISVVSEFISTAQVAQNQISSEFADYVASVAQSQTSLSELGEMVGRSGVIMSQTLDSVVGKVLIAVLVVLGVIVGFILVFVMYRVIRIASQSATKWEETTTEF